MDVVALVSSCFKRNKKVGRSVLAVLDYMFHGSCRRVSKVLKQMKSSVEKVFTWLTSKFRRLAIRWGLASTFTGIIQLACINIPEGFSDEFNV